MKFNKFLFIALSFIYIPIYTYSQQGCTDDIACNYNENATIDDGSCVLLDGICETCSEDGLSVVDNDSDDDGVCDADEVVGCTDNTACNYDFSATDSDNTLCTYQSTYYYDVDGDGLGDLVTQLFHVFNQRILFLTMMILVQMTLRMMQMEMVYVRVMR